MSLEYLSLCQGFTLTQHQTMERLFQAISLATASQSRAHEAAITIQRHWRGYRDRAYCQYLHSCALTIQSCYRAHKGRQRFRHQQQHYAEKQQYAYYHIQAILIQKIFRGFYSRKHIQDCRKRKQYIQTVQQKGEALHDRMEATYQQQVRDSIMARQNSDYAEFTHLTENIHHLISTRAIPGVFGSKPGLGEESKTMAYEKPMEEHIKEAFVNRQQKLKTLRETMVVPRRHHSLQTSQSQSSITSPSSHATRTTTTTSTTSTTRGSSIRAVLEQSRRDIQNVKLTSSSRGDMKYTKAPSEEKEMDGSGIHEKLNTSIRGPAPIQIRRKWAHPIGNMSLNGTTTLTSSQHPSQPVQPRRPSQPKHARPQSQPQSTQ